MSPGLKDQVLSWLYTLHAHDQNETQALLRKATAKGLGLDPETNVSTFPGSTVNILTAPQPAAAAVPAPGPAQTPAAAVTPAGAPAAAPASAGSCQVGQLMTLGLVAAMLLIGTILGAAAISWLSRPASFPGQPPAPLILPAPAPPQPTPPVPPPVFNEKDWRLVLPDAPPK
jgi:hypothetical protein